MRKAPKRSREQDALQKSRAFPKAATLKSTAPGVDKRAAVPVRADDPWSMDRIKADLSTSGIVGNASLVGAFNAYSVPDYSLQETIFSLQALVKKSKGGSTAFADEMLIPQACVLNAIFFEMTRRAANHIGNPDLVDRYLRLGLKAQSQSRATLESLSKIKNPPNVVVKQANIANGPQQINNGASRGEAPRTPEFEEPPIELLEAQNGKWMDARAPAATGRSDSAVESVGPVDRPADG